VSSTICVSLLALVLGFDPVGSCQGDLNGDRKVDGRDLSALLYQYGNHCPPYTPSQDVLNIKDTDEREMVMFMEQVSDRPRADINGDCVVNNADLSVLLSTYGCEEF